MAATVMELYGSKVFNEHEMRERLPSSTYKSLKATIEKGQPLDLEVANVVASVMKRWAIEQGSVGAGVACAAVLSDAAGVEIVSPSFLQAVISTVRESSAAITSRIRFIPFLLFSDFLLRSINYLLL